MIFSFSVPFFIKSRYMFNIVKNVKIRVVYLFVNIPILE